MSEASLKSQYDTLKTDRQPTLKRAHECAKLTIPSLIPSETEQTAKNSAIELEQPWQAAGSMGVNTLTAKLVLTLLPANSAFFQYNMSRQAREELLQLEGKEAAAFEAELDAGLQRREQDIVESMEASPLRSILFNVMKHLLVAGNYLLYLGDEIKGFPIYKYVVRRDSAGNVMKIIVREVVDKKTLPEPFQKVLDEDPARGDKGKEASDELDIYTVIERTRGDNWTSYQEVHSKEVPGTRGAYKTDTLPWLPLRMISVDGEDYGRSYCEELFGDLQSAEELTKAIVQGGQIASKLLWLINPNGVTDVDDVVEAPNGDAIAGREDDIGVLRSEKMADFQIAERVLGGILERLMRAFLMTSSVQRDAERVTAFEVSMMSQEIEDVLGGYYSLLGQELQLPLVRRWDARMVLSGDLDKLPPNMVSPTIITGVGALGRGQDLQSLRGFAQDLVALAQAKPGLLDRVKDGELLQRFANGHNLDTLALIKSDEEYAQEQAQAQQDAMQAEAISKGTGPAIQAAASAAQGSQ